MQNGVVYAVFMFNTIAETGARLPEFNECSLPAVHRIPSISSEAAQTLSDFSSRRSRADRRYVRTVRTVLRRRDRIFDFFFAFTVRGERATGIHIHTRVIIWSAYRCIIP